MRNHETREISELGRPIAESEYVGGKWTAPRPFVSLINEAAPQAGASVCWLSEDWIARLHKQAAVRYIHGYAFPLNNATSALIATDKVSTFTLLSDTGVTAVPHHLVRIPSSGNLAGAADRALTLVSPPLVVKPCDGAGGLDVYRAESIDDARSLIGRLATRYDALAVCPFEIILNEHRIVMLDNEPQLFFRKELQNQNEWRHNLRHGAVAVLEESPEVRGDLTAIARRAMQVIGGRFMTVDIIETPTGRKVLEINGGVTLDRFAAQSPANRACAVDIYREAICRCF